MSANPYRNGTRIRVRWPNGDAVEGALDLMDGAAWVRANGYAHLITDDCVVSVIPDLTGRPVFEVPIVESKVTRL